MNDILLPITFSTFPLLPVVLVATFIYIAIKKNRSKVCFLGYFFPLAGILTMNAISDYHSKNLEGHMAIIIVLVTFYLPLLYASLVYSGIRLYSVYSHQLLKASLILGIYLLASIFMHLMIFKVQGQFIKVVINIHLAKVIITILSFLPSVYLYFDKNQQFQGFVSDEGVEDEN
ncbi:hypothetical protein [Streptococcus australis]|uniref:hypothetical protein n=1 Tax=Streptococcus australis TaxID=113107 RepID=UPI00233065D9|nr:hypothetical protein [Streptococcus australis]MDB8641870.1 hypothetical protein [Streptococcus australis]MDB8645537.1 hypothetical protein [Streptococcus australis]